MEPREEELRAAPAALLRSMDGRGLGGRSTDSVRRAAELAATGSIFSGGSEVSRRSCTQLHGGFHCFVSGPTW